MAICQLTMMAKTDSKLSFLRQNCSSAVRIGRGNRRRFQVIYVSNNNTRQTRMRINCPISHLNGLARKQKTTISRTRNMCLISMRKRKTTSKQTTTQQDTKTRNMCLISIVLREKKNTQQDIGT